VFGMETELRLSQVAARATGLYTKAVSNAASGRPALNTDALIQPYSV